MTTGIELEPTKSTDDQPRDDQVLEVSDAALEKLAKVAEDPEAAGKGVRIYPAGVG